VAVLSASSAVRTGAPEVWPKAARGTDQAGGTAGARRSSDSLAARPQRNAVLRRCRDRDSPRGAARREPRGSGALAPDQLFCAPAQNIAGSLPDSLPCGALGRWSATFLGRSEAGRSGATSGLGGAVGVPPADDGSVRGRAVARVGLLTSVAGEHRGREPIFDRYRSPDRHAGCRVPLGVTGLQHASTLRIAPGLSNHCCVGC
jgi:hypothetical protein